MAIPILNEIEKLINEHGSAVILKERLALAADQYAALERKIIELEANSKQSKMENKSLYLKLEQAELKIRDLEEKLIERHNLPLKEIEINILKSISEKPKTAKEIAQQISSQEETIRYYLEELKTKNIIVSSYVPLGVGDIWSLEQLGRKYLIENDLMK